MNEDQITAILTDLSEVVGKPTRLRVSPAVWEPNARLEARQVGQVPVIHLTGGLLGAFLGRSDEQTALASIMAHELGHLVAGDHREVALPIRLIGVVITSTLLTLSLALHGMGPAVLLLTPLLAFLCGGLVVVADVVRCRRAENRADEFARNLIGEAPLIVAALRAIDEYEALLMAYRAVTRRPEGPAPSTQELRVRLASLGLSPTPLRVNRSFWSSHPSTQERSDRLMAA